MDEMAILRFETCPRCDGLLSEVVDIYGTDQHCWRCGYAGPIKEPDPIPAGNLCHGSGHLPKRITTIAGMGDRTKVPSCDACGQRRFLKDGMISPPRRRTFEQERPSGQAVSSHVDHAAMTIEYGSQTNRLSRWRGG